MTGDRKKPRTGDRRFRLPVLIAIALAAILSGAALGFAVTSRPSPVRDDRLERANAIYTAWNDMAGSMEAENKILDELQQNLKDNPPHLVFDSRRRALYQLAIAEHLRQLKDLETMKVNDK
jgi:hypothetical protein